jgi:hypothetical protein
MKKNLVAPAALPFFGGHSKTSHLSSNKGGVSSLPIVMGP